jgi:hypothetical protein
VLPLQKQGLKGTVKRPRQPKWSLHTLYPDGLQTLSLEFINLPEPVTENEEIN